MQMRTATILGAYTPADRKEQLIDNVDLTDGARVVNEHANNALVDQLNLYVRAYSRARTYKLKHEASEHRRRTNVVRPVSRGEYDPVTSQYCLQHPIVSVVGLGRRDAAV